MSPQDTTPPQLGGPTSAAFKRRFIARMIVVLTGGMLLDGYILGIIGPITGQVSDSLGLSTTQEGLVAAAALFGILFGSPLGGWASDRFGRKPLFMIDMALFVILSATQFFVTSFAALLIIRLLMGVAIGVEYSVGWPMMSEFAPARLRGRLMATVNVAWYGGFMIGYAVSYWLNQSTPPVSWRVILGTSTILAVLLFLGRIGMPESPRWLWSKGRKDEALVIARRYLASEDEVADMEQEDVRKGSVAMLFSKPYWRSTVFVSWFWFCNVLPYFAIATFADAVLQKYGLSGGLAGGVGLSAVALLGVIVTMLLIDKAGRRVFTVPQQWIILVVFLILGFWAGAPAAVVLCLFLVFSFASAMNGVLTSVYPGEVFPTEIRGVGTGFATAVSRIGAALGTFLLPILIDKFGVPTTMLFAAVVVFTGAVVSQLWAPETKGKSLAETAAGFTH